MVLQETIKNEDYNFLRKRMLRLEETYKQSTDQKVRQVVKEKTLYEICDRFPNFYDKFSYLFDKCQMSSLIEITDLIDNVMSKYSVEPLMHITENEIKRLLKLKEKNLRAFVREYNAEIENKKLTYYSQRIDNKLVFLTIDGDKIVGTVTDITPNIRSKECLCHFCRQFRRGDDIIFVTNINKNHKGDYSSIGQTVCSNYEMCNKNIESREDLIKFLEYKKTKKNK